MYALPRKSAFFWACCLIPVCGLVLACVVIGLWFSPPAHADVGIQPIFPGGSSIKPEEESQVRMVAETVVMKVRSAGETLDQVLEIAPEAAFLLRDSEVPAIAEVKADFTMKNPTADPVSMAVWFPLASAIDSFDWDVEPPEAVPRIARFQVTVDGKPVDYAASTLPNPKGADKPPLPWASFPVTFPASEETRIQVTYLLPLHRATKGRELVLYYIFQTGSGWAGPIGQAELVVNLPYPASEATLAGASSATLVEIPYPSTLADRGASPGGVLEGNQARWTWQDFEPGPQDDFAIWLMDPDDWQRLEAARAAVQANPQDGQAWLHLASIYYYLSLAIPRTFPCIFAASYSPLGMEAFSKAADLLPDHPAPHMGLALLSLAPYAANQNAPPEVIQTVLDELQLARKLEVENPSLVGEFVNSTAMFEDFPLWFYSYYNATATANWATWSTEWAKETAEAALLETLSGTPIMTPSHTPRLIGATSPPPTIAPPTAEIAAAARIGAIKPPTTPIITAETTGYRQSPVIIVAAVIIGLGVLVCLGVLVYLAWLGMRKSAGK